MSADIEMKAEERVHAEAVRMGDAELAVAIREILGAKLVAYIGGVKSTRSVSQWAEGVAIGSPEARDRLVLAYRVARIIVERDSNRVAQVWFQGMNPLLADQAPARVIAKSDPAGEEAVGVLRAARHFVAMG